MLVIHSNTVCLLLPSRRNAVSMSENLRSALNALLYRTGDQSRDIVLVVATNRPEDLDRAVVDRVDEALEFPLPGQQEREKLIRLYLDKYIVKAGEDSGRSWRRLLSGGSDKIELQGITDDVSMTSLGPSFLSFCL
jgi:ATPase family AAA domain-containing protein 3A/B